MTRRLLPLVAAALVLASCNGDDDATATTTVTTAVTTVVTTAADTTVEETAARTTTVVPDTTSAETTTTTTTTTVVATTLPDTTVGPTTTDPAPTTAPDGVPPRVTFPDDPARQAIVDAGYAYFDALRAASAAPSDTRLREAIEATMTDPIAERVLAFLDELVANDERVVASTEQASYLEVFEPTVIIVDTVATFDTCAVDADVRVDAEGSPVDDSITSAAQTYNFTLVDGVWRVSDITRFGRFEGQVGCGGS